MLYQNVMSQAYKHFQVHSDDLPLQVLVSFMIVNVYLNFFLKVFKIANRLFVDLRLVFGAVSSPALFDQPNWLITEATWRLSGFPRICIVKQLAPDDETDCEKAFTAVVEGTVLSVVYRTKEWL